MLSQMLDCIITCYRSPLSRRFQSSQNVYDRKNKYYCNLKHLKDLEEISSSFPGVSKSYAVQAGREIRIIVESKEVSDDDTLMLARDIAKKIESTLTYPGQIKVTVIRETRAVEYAK